jgi:hypothetical protein
MWGASVQQQLNLSVSPSMDYKFEGIGDFNGDFSDDLLLRHKDGRTFVWYLNGSKVTAKRQTSHKLANSRTVEAVADFNGDGKADILWRHVYALSIWEMDGHSRQRTVQIGAQAHKNELRLDALGDYNGDGHLDMLWRGRSGFVLAHPHNAFMVYLDGHGDLAR